MKKLFFIFMLSTLSMSADMQYNKTNNCFFSTVLTNPIDQYEYNSLVVMFLQGLVDFIKTHNDIQAGINERFGAKFVNTSADCNQYVLIFINTLMSSKTIASNVLVYDLQQPKTFKLLQLLTA